MARTKLQAKEEIKNYTHIITLNQEDLTHLAGKWHSTIFTNTNPIHIEIGCGKGNFITTLAQRNPRINYIALEIKEERILAAAKKAVTYNLTNIHFLQTDIMKMAEIFAPEELSAIYINFQDPWPKRKHEKHRMTSRKFIELYEHLLPENGEVFLKSDNQFVFYYSGSQFLQHRWLITHQSINVPQSEENIETEYEMKYRAKGVPIYEIHFKKRTAHN